MPRQRMPALWVRMSIRNGQTSKGRFFNQDIKDLGYLPNQIVKQISPYELKRGSVVPATLITGLNSDLRTDHRRR